MLVLSLTPAFPCILQSFYPSWGRLIYYCMYIKSRLIMILKSVCCLVTRNYAKICPAKFFFCKMSFLIVGIQGYIFS